MSYQRRMQPTEGDVFGSDSFLDVVTNVVGILIILVVVVGLRVKNAPASALEMAAEVDLAPQAKTHDQLTGDVDALAAQLEIIDADTAEKRHERDALAVVVAGLEQELASRRGQLDAGRQAAFDLQRRLADAQAQLADADRQLAAAQAAPTQAVTVLNYPTPISRMVEGQEVHFQILGRRIKHIPLEKLLEQFKREAQSRVYKLRDRPDMTGTVGPIDGFRLQYTLARVDVAQGGQVGSYAQLVEWTLKPTSDSLGESLEAALEPQSEFTAVIASHHPRKCTITLWVYPDSFAEFRGLKQRLYEQGYATACRPLPAGIEIGGSPQGSRSVAE